jgi:hypothetical protein
MYGLMLLNERLFALLRVTFLVRHSERSEESQMAVKYKIPDSSREGTAPCEAKAGLSRRERVFKISMDGKF